MAVTATWTNPSSTPPDGTTGSVFTQTMWEDALSDLMYLGGSDGNTPTSVQFYDVVLYIQSGNFTAGTTGFLDGNNWDASESFGPGNQRRVTRAISFTRMYADATAAASAGQSYTYTVRKNGVDTAITCAISGASATSASDTAHSVAYAINDNYGCKVVTSASATATKHIVTIGR